MDDTCIRDLICITIHMKKYLPSTQFDSLIKPLLIHGRLHQLSLQIMEQIKKHAATSHYSANAVCPLKFIIDERKATHHLHTLHQRQTNSLIARQADGTGWGVRGSLHQGYHRLHTQLTALETQDSPYMCI